MIRKNLIKGSAAAKEFMSRLRLAKKGAVKKVKTVKKTIHKIKKSTMKGITHIDNEIDFFEKNRQEYNKYNHLIIYRSYRGRDRAKLNDKVIALSKAYNLINKGGYIYSTQTNLGSVLIIDYRKLK